MGTTRGTLSWPQPSDKVVKKPTDIRHIDAIFLLYQASVKSNSEMIFCLGITKENTKFLDLEKNVRDINLLRVTIRTLPYFELEKI